MIFLANNITINEASIMVVGGQGIDLSAIQHLMELKMDHEKDKLMYFKKEFKFDLGSVQRCHKSLEIMREAMVMLKGFRGVF